MKCMKKADWFLLGVFLFVGCLGTLCFFFFAPKGDHVQVKVAGKVIAVYPLDEDGVYEIKGVAGKNQLVIKNGEAWMQEATCPDKLCVYMGHIKKEGQSVICLPNQITVEIVGGSLGRKSSETVDMIAG